MNEHDRSGDPAFDRLAAADPTRHAPELVQGVLRAKVDALIAEDAGSDDPASSAGAAARDAGGEPAGGTDDRPDDELAGRRQRRHTPWLVAAAVAGIVAAGGGGYLAGDAGIGPASTTVETLATGPAPAADTADGNRQGDSGQGDSGQGDSGQSGAAENGGDGPSVLGAPEAPASEGVEPLDADGGLPTASAVLFHAGAGLSKVPGTGEVRVAGTSQSLGAYPVISEVAAVDRLGDPRFAGAVLGPRTGDGAPRAGSVPAPGDPIVWPVQEVTIVAATRTEVRYTLLDGAALLVPAYELADAQGSTWTVMAVDEELLDLTP